jgi:hypothetical protein
VIVHKLGRDRFTVDRDLQAVRQIRGEERAG